MWRGALLALEMNQRLDDGIALPGLSFPFRQESNLRGCSLRVKLRRLTARDGEGF